MGILAFSEFLPRLMSSATLSDNSIGMLACLIGMAAALYMNNRQQLKAKKAKIEERKEEPRRRD